jgi:hypothetical protein
VSAEKNQAADQLNDLAVVHAQCAAATKDDPTAAKAVDFLRRAVAKGFKDTTRLKKDGDLDSLRPRDDFQKLVESL